MDFFQRKILRILNTHMPKKKKKIWGHRVHIWVYVRTSRMQIRKKWLNQLKNFFYKRFWEYYLASFCWWISSSCENHCTLIHSHLQRYLVISTVKFYPLPPPLPSISGLKLVCDVNIVYGNIKSENSEDYAQKPQRNCTFMNSASTWFSTPWGAACPPFPYLGVTGQAVFLLFLTLMLPTMAFRSRKGRLSP